MTNHKTRFIKRIEGSKVDFTTYHNPLVTNGEEESVLPESIVAPNDKVLERGVKKSKVFSSNIQE